MSLFLFFFGICAACLGQSPSAKWQVATPLEVKVHQPEPGRDAAQLRYDITVRVGIAEYVVLYTPPDGISKPMVESCLGIDGLVLVGTDTIKYNDMLGRTHEVPILVRPTTAVNNPQNQAKE